MTDKEVRKLKRTALIELLVEKMETIEKLEAALAEAEKKLEDRRIAVSKVGSIAEAALAINDVFSAADDAAAQYIENIRDARNRTLARNEALTRKAEQEAEEIVRSAKKQAAAILTEAGASAPAEPKKSERPAPSERKPKKPDRPAVPERKTQTKEEKPVRRSEPREEAVPQPVKPAGAPPKPKVAQEKPVRSPERSNTAARPELDDRFAAVFAQMRRQNQ